MGSEGGGCAKVLALGPDWSGAKLGGHLVGYLDTLPLTHCHPGRSPRGYLASAQAAEAVQVVATPVVKGDSALGMRFAFS